MENKELKTKSKAPSVHIYIDQKTVELAKSDLKKIKEAKSLEISISKYFAMCFSVGRKQAMASIGIDDFAIEQQ
jgi:uncharacterized protein YlbG (UPF0298 family)